MHADAATGPTASTTAGAQTPRSRPWRLAALFCATLLAVFLLVFDWNWLRHPLELYISNKTQREFHASHLDVELGLVPVIKLRDVYFANAPWSKNTEPTARIGSLAFSVSLRDLWDTKKIYIPRATLSDAELQLERAPDLKKNWVLKEPERSAEPSRVRIGSISVDRGRLRYMNHANPFAVDIVATPSAPQKSSPPSARFTTHLEFKGQFRQAAFSGNAITGDVISLRDTNVAFPIKGTVASATNRLEVGGSMTDVADFTAVDLNFHIAGQSLSTLRAVLNLPLSASLPYAFRGHLLKNTGGYVLEDLTGKVGSSDLRGKGEYKEDGPRPKLSAELASTQLNIAELFGKNSANNASAPLPGTSGGAQFSAIDAQVKYAAAKLQLSRSLPVEDMRFVLTLKNAVAKLSPLEIGLAGGRIISELNIDARDKNSIRSSLNADLRRIQLARLLPVKGDQAKPLGELGGQIRLKGAGTSISDLSASASGTITAALAEGRISSVLDAAAGMNGGKVLSAILGGDKGVKVNCAGLHFDVRNGVGRSRLLMVDTEQTRADGSGMFNLKEEKFAFTLEPKPKKPGILSMRTPLYVHGTFGDPHISFEKGQLALRAGGAVALALINPIAALLPLIETGSGANTDCEKVLAAVPGARQQMTRKGSALPSG